jgi:cell division septation protein DedD
MWTIDCATDTGLEESQGAKPESDVAQPQPGGVSKPLKGLFLAFAATVTIGLALASWYVGVRIVAADEAAPGSAATSVTSTVNTAANPEPVAVRAPAASSAPAASLAPAAVKDSLAERSWYVVPPADLYLQVAGLGPKQDADFVKTLQARGYRARVQTADKFDDARILIGPFSSHANLARAQRKLQSAGVLAIETAR